MLVHAPADRPAGAALVVVLHGLHSDSVRLCRWGGLDRARRPLRLRGALPGADARQQSQPLLQLVSARRRTARRGEAASIHAMVRQAIAEYDLDPRQVFVTGLSAGGAMANVMLAAYPETFAGGAIIAGLPYGSASNMPEAFAAMRHARLVPSDALGDAVRSASGPHRPLAACLHLAGRRGRDSEGRSGRRPGPAMARRARCGRRRRRIPVGRAAASYDVARTPAARRLWNCTS